MYAFETSLDGHNGWILGQDGANRLLLSAGARLSDSMVGTYY